MTVPYYSGVIVRCSTEIVESCRAVSIDRVVSVFRFVDRELDKVSTKTIALGVCVCKTTRLKNCEQIVTTCFRLTDLKEHLLGSGDSAHPGTTLVGLNALCSLSAKKLHTFPVNTISPNFFSGKSAKGRVFVGSNMFMG